jgi:uncharacterized protein YjdB
VLGDYLKVQETIADGTNEPYNGLYQFDAGATITELNKNGAPAVSTDAAILTADLANAFAGSSFAPTAVKKYSWQTTIALSGTYPTTNFDGSSVSIEPAYMDTAAFTLVTGHTYDIEAYFIGYSVAHTYASVMVTKATEVTILPTAITISAVNAATSVRVAETLSLTATVAPSNATDKSVTWTSSDVSKATVDATGLVTGVAVTESVVITATSNADSTIKGTIALLIAEKAAAPVSSLDVDSESASLLVTDTHQIVPTVLPADANQNVTYASDAVGVATVTSNGLITAVGAGMANITVTTVGVTAASVALTKTVAVTIALLPGTTATTIADLLALTASDTTHLYQVSGILEGLSHTDTYGDVYLTDPTTGKTITVYGSTTTASSVTYSGGVLSYVSPKDAVTALASYNNGELVTLNCIYIYFGGKSSEIEGFFTAHVADTTGYNVTVDATTNGTVTPDITTAAYGQIVTLTVTPADGYVVDAISVKNAQGKSIIPTVNAGDSTKYTFSATCVNEVIVTFKVYSAFVSSLNLTVDTLSLASSAYTASQTATISGVGITAIGCGNYGTGIQMRLSTTTGNSDIYNTTATPSAIKSIVITLNTSKGGITKNLFAISGGTSAITSAVNSDEVAFVSGQLVYTANYTQVSGFTFFNFGHTITNTGSFYVDSVVVNLYTPS